jgi:hypothetical protein
MQAPDEDEELARAIELSRRDFEERERERRRIEEALIAEEAILAMQLVGDKSKLVSLCFERKKKKKKKKKKGGSGAEKTARGVGGASSFSLSRNAHLARQQRCHR